jgi:hypothetical protein
VASECLLLRGLASFPTNPLWITFESRASRVSDLSFGEPGVVGSVVGDGVQTVSGVTVLLLFLAARIGAWTDDCDSKARAAAMEAAARAIGPLGAGWLLSLG